MKVNSSNSEDGWRDDSRYSSRNSTQAPSVQAVRLAIMETTDQVRGCCYELCRIITGGGNTGNSIKFGSSPLPGLPSSDGV